eukprot:3729390-Rhodomonas_salina.2
MFSISYKRLLRHARPRPLLRIVGRRALDPERSLRSTHLVKVGNVHRVMCFRAFRLTSTYFPFTMPCTFANPASCLPFGK